MVWQSVKLVLPMKIQCNTKAGTADMNVYSRLPTCNVALAQSPMNAFRQTTLVLNGRIFSEDNFFRDTLDACYRGVGSQAYGDNHSLKPIVLRNLKSTLEGHHEPVLNRQGQITADYVVTDALEHRTLSGAFSLLEHNGPFIERARLFQDNLHYDGKTWEGEIQHLLEIGPFQARARKGNTAVPYIQDFHLRLNFQNLEARFDSVNSRAEATDGDRIMAPKLLEFATLPNFLHHTEQVDNHQGWTRGYDFTYTAQPYLEVTYTKHEGPMRPSYNLRCFEHVYEQGNRFHLILPVNTFTSPSSLQRVTTRLLSLPTKVYVWAEPADEYKHAFITGGVRRSCLLENIHLRVNQRPDVMFNPSQEECYEMFKRHTNSSLEYGSWLKSPIYCFDMVDVGQPDMFANDARITWFEWDTDVKLTELQMTEQANVNDANLYAHGYASGLEDTMDNFAYGQNWASSSQHIYGAIDPWQQSMRNTDTDLNLMMVASHPLTSVARQLSYSDSKYMKGVDIRLVERSRLALTGADFLINAIEGHQIQLNGFIWARVALKAVAEGDVGFDTSVGAVAKGQIISNAFWYIPESFRFVPSPLAQNYFCHLSALTFAAHYSFTNPAVTPVIITGELAGNRVGAVNGDKIGVEVGGATWAPGPYGYRIDGAGIQNDTLYGYDAANGLPALPVVKETDGAQAWVCFAPQTNMPSDSDGHSIWNKYLHSYTANEVFDSHAPDYWPAQAQGADSTWGSGQEALCIQTSGVWGTREQEIFNKGTVMYPADGDAHGAQVVRNNEVAGQWSKQTEYRLKTLYEYGNCQYSFTQDAAPTRILPNVVPVGPSAGIPFGL